MSTTELTERDKIQQSLFVYIKGQVHLLYMDVGQYIVVTNPGLYSKAVLYIYI